MKSTLKYLLPTALCLTFVCTAGCSTAPKTEAKRRNLVSQATEAVDQFKLADPTVEPFLKNAYGYAVFPNIGKGAIGVGGIGVFFVVMAIAVPNFHLFGH